MITTMQKWDEWFEATGDEQAQREWRITKSVHKDPVMLDTWAAIIELNRLDRLNQTTTPHQSGGV